MTQDDSAIRPAARRFMGRPAKDWISVQKWEDLFSEVDTLKPGAAAFVVEGVPGAVHHAFAVVNTSDKGLQIADTRQGTAWIGKADAKRMRAPLEARALIIDGTGQVRAGRGLPPASNSIARAITDPFDFRIGAVGVEIETDFALDWHELHRIEIDRLATSPLVALDADTYMNIPIVEIVGQPTRALPGETRAHHEAVWGEIRRVWHVLDQVNEHTPLARLFPGYQMEEEVDEYDVTILPPPSPQQPGEKRRFYVQFSVGVAPFSESRLLEFAAGWSRSAPRTDIGLRHARTGLDIGKAFSAQFAGVPQDAVMSDLALDYDTQSLFGHIATFYTQVAAQLEGAIRKIVHSDSQLWKNYAKIAGRTTWRAKFEYLPSSVRAFLELHSGDIRASFEQAFSSDNRHKIERLHRAGHPGSLWDLPISGDGNTVDHTTGQFFENGVTLNPQKDINPYRSLGIRNYLLEMDAGGEDAHLEPKVSVWEVRQPPQGGSLDEIEEHYREITDFTAEQYRQAILAFSIAPQSTSPVAEIPFDARDKEVGDRQRGLLQEIAKYIAQEAVRRRAASSPPVTVYIEGGGKGGLTGDAAKAGNARAGNVADVLKKTVADLLGRRGRNEPVETLTTFVPITRGKGRTRSPYPLAPAANSDDGLRRVVIWVDPARDLTTLGAGPESSAQTSVGGGGYSQVYGRAPGGRGGAVSFAPGGQRPLPVPQLLTGEQIRPGLARTLMLPLSQHQIRPVAGHGRWARINRPLPGVTTRPSINQNVYYSGQEDQQAVIAEAADFVQQRFPVLGQLNVTGDTVNCNQAVLAVDRMLNGALEVRVPPSAHPGFYGLDLLRRRYHGAMIPVVSYDQIIDRIAQVPGSRGVVYLGWPDGGHLFNVVYTEAGVVFLDGQTGGLATLRTDAGEIALMMYHPHFPSAVPFEQAWAAEDHLSGPAVPLAGPGPDLTAGPRNGVGRADAHPPEAHDGLEATSETPEIVGIAPARADQPNTVTDSDGLVWTYPSASDGMFCVNVTTVWLE